MCFSFSDVGTFTEDYCVEGNFFVVLPADTLGNSVVSYGFKSICYSLTCNRKTAERTDQLSFHDNLLVCNLIE